MSRLKTYNKLVRDKIPEYIEAKGEPVFWHVATDAEYATKLMEKLLEEVKEFLAEESIDEFADLMEVVDAIAAYKKFTPARIKTIRAAKAAEKGRFKKQIILERS